MKSIPHIWCRNNQLVGTKVSKEDYKFEQQKFPKQKIIKNSKSLPTKNHHGIYEIHFKCSSADFVYFLVNDVVPVLEVMMASLTFVF